MNNSFWQGKRVFLTGHTGFKGGWLALWLHGMGAKVFGYSLAPPTDPNLFTVARVDGALREHVEGDIRDLPTLSRAMTDADPEIVFHLAAQPLVRHSYLAPVETYAVNVMGTVHVLEAARLIPGVRAVVVITTDKCYENKEWVWGYREDETLGGHDPYSNSKACAELVTAAYRKSFLAQAGTALASARAGNVIGGGDWAADRLVPDFLRAMDARRPLEIRFPQATRPWQHVLEPLSGYLKLGEKLLAEGSAFAGPWNFGPSEEDAKPVHWLLDRLTAASPGTSWLQVGNEHVHEAGYLKLDSSKARTELDWRPHWSLEQALQQTLVWHNAWRAGRDMHDFSIEQIHAYSSAD